MEQIELLIKSPIFWFASVFIAFIINVFAGFAKDWVQKWLDHISINQEKRSKEKDNQFKEKVQKLIENPQLIGLYQSNIIYQKIRQALYLTVSYFFMGFAFYTFGTGLQNIALMFMFLSVATFLIALANASNKLASMRAVINEAIDDDEVYLRD